MKKEYYLDRDIRGMIIFPAFVIIGLREIANFIMLLGDNKIDITAYLLSLFIFITGIFFIVVAYTEKLIVSPDGISLEYIGFSLFVKWKDMNRIGFRRYLSVSYEGIFVPREKVTVKGVNGFWIFGKEVTINLFRYGDDWRNSELGQQIKQYAPHLFTS